MDAYQNFAVGAVSGGYQLGDTTIDLVPGYVSRFPAAPFYAVWWDATLFPAVWDDPNREIVRVTSIGSDTLTITRGQENTTASAKDTPDSQYMLMQTVTAALLGQIEALVGDPAVAGDITGTISAASLVPGVIVNADINASADIAQSKIADLVSDLVSKSPLESPAFTGAPTAPTPAANDNTTRLATTEYVQTEISGIGGSDPTMLGDITGVASNNEIAAGVIVNADINTSAGIAYSKLSLTNSIVNGDLFGNIAQSKTTNLVSDLALKAPVASPTFTGVPAAPTAAAATNTTQLATTAFVRTEVANLVASAPGTLDTLDELAAALADDPSFATTMTTALALKAPLASPTLTGVPVAPTAAANTNTTQLATTAFVIAEQTAYASDSVAFTNKTVSGLTVTSTTGTLTIANGKTLTASNSLTIAGTDGNTVTIPSGGGTMIVAGGAIGAATATTPAVDDNSTKVATTAYVQTELTAYDSDARTFSNKTFADLTISGAATIGSILFEGTTADAFETNLTVVDPTADRTISLPNADGTVALVAGDIGAATATTPAANDNDTSVATTAYVQTELTAYNDDTVTLTNKTLSVGSNVLVFDYWLTVGRFPRVDGTGCTLGTTSTLIDYGYPSFSGTADQAANWCEWREPIPADFDVTGILSALVHFKLNGADTGTHRYVLSMACPALSSAAAPALSFPINLDYAGDASGADQDMQRTGLVSLTNWNGAMGQSRILVIRLARDGDAAEDGSTVASTVLGVAIRMRLTQ